MPRHHNRAILSEITEHNLNPAKEYVAGKNGLMLSAKELKKISVKEEPATTFVHVTSKDETVLPTAEVVLDEKDVETKVEDQIELKKQVVVDSTEVLHDYSSDKSVKFKKKVKKLTTDQS